MKKTDTIESLRAQVAALTKRQQENAEKFYTPNAALEAQLAAAQAHIAQLREALEKIAEVCNGYDLEAGWACRHAREALAKVTP
jgi:DNA-binding protein H-NS